MATQNYFYLEDGTGVTALLEFNDVNLRISDFVLTVPTGMTVRCYVGEGGNVAWDQTFTEGTYRQVVPGNHRMIEFVGSDGLTSYRLPEVEWGIQIT